MQKSKFPILGCHPTIAEVKDHYLCPSILSEIFLATQVRDVTYIYRGLDGCDTHIDLHPENIDELESFLRQFFEEHEGRIEPYPWFTIGVDDLSEATAYSRDPRHLIGWDAVIEFDYRWLRSFGELYNGMQVLDDFGIFYRAKFSGHHSLHFILPAEAMPGRFRQAPDRERWCETISKVGEFVSARSHYLQHGWTAGWGDEEMMYSAPYSVHRTFGLVAVPLLGADYRRFRPWMANIHLTVPVDNWWSVPDEAGENIQKLLDYIDSSRKVIHIPEKVEDQSEERKEKGYVPLAVQRSHKIAETVDEATFDLQNADVQYRRRAAWALMVQGTEAIEELVYAAGDEDWVVRWFALEALGRAVVEEAVGPECAVSAAEAGLEDENEYVYQSALDLLCRSGKSGRARLLHLIWKDPGTFWTLRNWVEQQGEAGIEELIEFIASDDSQLSGAALQVTGNLASFAAPRLLELMSSLDENLRLKALSALLDIGEGARPFLKIAVEREHEPACGLARHAIDALDKVQTDQHWQSIIPLAKIALLMSMEESLSLPMLRQQLESPDKKTRFMASRALYHFGETAVPMLTDLLCSRDAELRRRASEILRDLAPEGVGDALCDALSDEDVKVRQNAVHALGRIGKPDDLQSLRALLSDSSRAVRRTVREVLKS